jgi:coproporphyrinogen III oxidase-like Fe-S oxidoreductase
VAELEAAGGGAAAAEGGERIDRGEELLDTLMLGLRLAEGLRVEHLARRFGAAAASEVLQLRIVRLGFGTARQKVVLE